MDGAAGRGGHSGEAALRDEAHLVRLRPRPDATRLFHVAVGCAVLPDEPNDGSRGVGGNIGGCCGSVARALLEPSRRAPENG